MSFWHPVRFIAHPSGESLLTVQIQHARAIIALYQFDSVRAANSEEKKIRVDFKSDQNAPLNLRHLYTFAGVFRKRYNMQYLIPLGQPIPTNNTYTIWLSDCIFPVWAPIVVLMGYPVVRLMRGPLRTYCRRRRGLCLGCGYDLTGNMGGRCPECGRALPDSRDSKSPATGGQAWQPSCASGRRGGGKRRVEE